MHEILYQAIAEAMVRGDETGALSAVRQALKQAAAPLDIVTQGLQPGLDRIDAAYEVGTCFVPELIIAGRIMRSAMRILDGPLHNRARIPVKAAKVVFGTVAGDIHTIGKDLVATLLTMDGFEVIDLGFNVPPETYVKSLERENAPILAMSALLTTARDVQRQTIEALKSAGMRQQVKVIVGGSAVTQCWADEIGADGYAQRATEAVTLCHRLMGSLDTGFEKDNIRRTDAEKVT
jgi:methanogenic corrinoid protein MtbC1